jgi:hypothetical protein
MANRRGSQIAGEETAAVDREATATNGNTRARMPRSGKGVVDQKDTPRCQVPRQEPGANATRDRLKSRDFGW